MYSDDNYREEVSSVFDLNFLARERVPIEVGSFRFLHLPEGRLNHYMVKLNNSDDYVLGNLNNNEIKEFIGLCLDKLGQLMLSVSERYCYITLDQKWVEKDKTQRTPGWHIDGMQGDEVRVKVPGDITFLWCNTLPTKFANQSFEISNLDPSTQNVFKHLSAQVRESSVMSAQENKIYLVGPYHVHEASEAKEKVFRSFLRLSYTNTPITSTKMTLNPEIKYNYEYHTTSGNIPGYLK